MQPELGGRMLDWHSPFAIRLNDNANRDKATPACLSLAGRSDEGRCIGRDNYNCLNYLHK